MFAIFGAVLSFEDHPDGAKHASILFCLCEAQGTSWFGNARRSSGDGYHGNCWRRPASRHHTGFVAVHCIISVSGQFILCRHDQQRAGQRALLGEVRLFGHSGAASWGFLRWSEVPINVDPVLFVSVVIPMVAYKISVLRLARFAAASPPALAQGRDCLPNRSVR